MSTDTEDIAHSVLTVTKAGLKMLWDDTQMSDDRRLMVVCDEARTLAELCYPAG